MTRTLAQAFPPGDFLAEEIAARHWTQSDFALILDRPAQFVSEIVAGKKEITRESAAQLAAALGTSAEYWLNLQNSFLLWQQAQDAKTRSELDEVRARALLSSWAPVSVLRKRGLLSEGSLEEQEEELRELFEVTTLDGEPHFLAAARRTNEDEPLNPTQLAWLACTRRKARARTANDYDSRALEDLAGSLSRLLRHPNAFSDLPTQFAEVGVRLVFLEAFPASKMNGAAFMLDNDPGQPVIALSGRGKRLDFVLFTLLHEVAHLVRGDIDTDNVLIDEDNQHTLGDEAATDELAATWALPNDLPAPPRPIRQGWVAQQADAAGVHPIVVVGRLQKAGLLEWRSQLVKGAPTVTEALESWG